jgi:hypothetical protein
MEVVIAGLAGMLVMVWKLVDFARLLTTWRTSRSATVTQVLAWLVSIAVVFLYGASQLGEFAIPGTELLLSDANVGTKIILGLAIGSAASAAVDVKQAIDSSDSNVKPPLLE